MRKSCQVVILFFLFLIEHSYAQTNNRAIGFRINTGSSGYVTTQNVYHLDPGVFMRFNRHTVYGGPEFNHVYRWTTMPSNEKYQSVSYGGHFGYAYCFTKMDSRIRAYSQLHFSVFNLKYEATSLGNPNPSSKSKTIVENNINIGGEIDLFDNLSAHLGIGFGSFLGFFLNIESFVPNGNIGLKYAF